MDITEICRLLAEHEQSDLSLAAFARMKGVPAYRLYDARRRVRHAEAKDAGSASRFAEIEVAEPEPLDRGSPIELRLPSGLTLSVDRSFDEVALRRILGVLAPC